MRLLGVVSLLVVVMSSVTSAGPPVTCPNPMFSVRADTRTLVDATCSAADHAVSVLAQCDMSLPDPIEVSIADHLPEECLGLFHCGQARIEILSPEKMLIARKNEGAFAAVPPDILFQSVLLHELVHAAYDKVECPFGDCRVTAEYLAYALQILDLPRDIQLAMMGDVSLEKKVSRDELNLMILLIAPDRFARKAAAHLSQRDDKCGYVHNIMSGNLILDREFHH